MFLQPQLLQATSSVVRCLVIILPESRRRQAWGLREGLAAVAIAVSSKQSCVAIRIAIFAAAARFVFSLTPLAQYLIWFRLSIFHLRWLTWLGVVAFRCSVTMVMSLPSFCIEPGVHFVCLSLFFLAHPSSMQMPVRDFFCRSAGLK